MARSQTISHSLIGGTPSVRYRHVLAFKECKLGTFVARSGMCEANRLAITSKMNPQERAQWYSGCEGGWRASFRAGVSAPDQAILQNSKEALHAAIAGLRIQNTYLKVRLKYPCQ
jgi:hypothetical protein